MASSYFYHRWDFDADVCLDCGKTRQEIEEAPGPERIGSKWKLGQAQCRNREEQVSPSDRKQEK
jgi:hypothetical protein